MIFKGLKVVRKTDLPTRIVASDVQEDDEIQH